VFLNTWTAGTAFSGVPPRNDPWNATTWPLTRIIPSGARDAFFQLMTAAPCYILFFFRRCKCTYLLTYFYSHRNINVTWQERHFVADATSRPDRMRSTAVRSDRFGNVTALCHVYHPRWKRVNWSHRIVTRTLIPTALQTNDVIRFRVNRLPSVLFLSNLFDRICGRV